MKLFFLSKENIELAKAEAKAIFGKGKLINNIFLVETNKKSNRLAYTRFILNLIIESDECKIKKEIEKTNWNKMIKGSFALFFLENKDVSQSLSRKYGGIVYNLLKKPKVSLENPKTKLIMLKVKNKIYVGVEEWENDEKFFDRRPNTRPGQQPITISPKLARACINLCNAEKEVYDPFCGVGGFLIEAGLMNLKAIGSDISQKMTDLCKNNLDHYEIKNYKIFKHDALKINKKYNYIVTDPPYGRASKVVGNNLYDNFLKRLKKILKKRTVVIFPNSVNAKELIKKNKLNILGHYSVYIHKNLSREIYVLD